MQTIRKDIKADSTLRTSQAVPHPSTNRALRRLTSEVRRDPVHSTRYGRQQEGCAGVFRGVRSAGLWLQAHEQCGHERRNGTESTKQEEADEVAGRQAGRQTQCTSLGTLSRRARGDLGDVGPLRQRGCFVASRPHQARWPRTQIRDSIVVSISACHAEDPGSIPGRGNLLSSEHATCGRTATQSSGAHILAHIRWVCSNSATAHCNLDAQVDGEHSRESRSSRPSV
jgi:hypothetical protein